MPRRSDTSTAGLLAFAHELADASGKVILRHFRRHLSVENKAADGGYDPVTAADRDAEQAMRKLVQSRHPDHGFEGEEYGADAVEARWRWVVDPIDGTRSFVLGLPTWGTLIGLTCAGAPVLGMMDQPYTRERFWAAGHGAWFSGSDGRRRRLRTRSVGSLSDAMMTTTHPDLFTPGEESRGFARMKAKVRACRYGGDCYAYCLLAAGHIDVIVEAGLKSYDVAALVPIIEAAGGVITTWGGAPATTGGRIVAAGNSRLHAEALRLLG